MDKIKKHLNQPIDIEIDGDMFRLLPLSITQFASTLVLGDKFERGTITTNDVVELIDVYAEVFMNSYPELNKDLSRQFVVSNFGSMMEVMEKLAPAKIDEKKIERLKKIKEMQNAKSDTKPAEEQTPQQG